jgi:hypothetical protein
MAEMNLLKGSFTGRLGRVCGTTWKGKAVVKASIFSKAPPSNAQTRSVRAFEALNRLSAAIARQGFTYMGLSQKTLLPHNAVAKFLKPLVKNHVFDIANTVEVIKKDGSQVILGFVYNKTTEIATLKIGLGDEYIPLTGTKTFINVFNQYGISFFGELIDTQDYEKSFFMPYSPENEYNAMIFIAEPAYKGVFLHGLDFKKGAGMQYSTDEQLTGDLWIDGQPIYQRTILLNNPATISQVWATGVILGALEIITSELTCSKKAETGDNRILSLPKIMWWTKSTGELTCWTPTQLANDPNSFRLTIKYIKKTS